MTAIIADTRYTVQEFDNLRLDDTQYELVGGRVVDRGLPTVQHGQIITQLSYELVQHLGFDARKQVLNVVAFILDDYNSVIPDLVFISARRLAEVDRDKPFPGPPDLAVEVIADDTVYELQRKILEYQKAGTRLIWVIYPVFETVEVYHPGSLKPKVLDQRDELDGEDVIPGFKLPVKTLFE